MFVPVHSSASLTSALNNVSFEQCSDGRSFGFAQDRLSPVRQAASMKPCGNLHSINPSRGKLPILRVRGVPLARQCIASASRSLVEKSKSLGSHAHEREPHEYHRSKEPPTRTCTCSSGAADNRSLPC